MPRPDTLEIVPVWARLSTDAYAYCRVLRIPWELESESAVLQCMCTARQARVINATPRDDRLNLALFRSSSTAICPPPLFHLRPRSALPVQLQDPLSVAQPLRSYLPSSPALSRRLSMSSAASLPISSSKVTARPGVSQCGHPRTPPKAKRRLLGVVPLYQGARTVIGWCMRWR